MAVVALVEDDHVDVIAVKRAMRQAELTCPVEVFLDGEDALAAARSGRFPSPCFLVLDLNLPRLPGLDLLQTLRRESHLTGCAVAVLTSSTADADHARARSLGVQNYLVKGSRDALPKLVDLMREYAAATQSLC
jgi:DNA-binding response OmpR family regulator